MTRKTKLLKFAVASIVPMALGAIPLTSVAQLSKGVPNFTARAADQGSLSSSQQLNLTIWLQLDNKAALDNAVTQMYTPGSATYHKWMSVADLKKFAPTTAQLNQIKKELTGHGLAIDEIEPNNLAIRVHGPVADVEQAFHTQIHQFGYNGKVLYANTTAPHLTGAANSLVSTVTGLTNMGVRPLAVQQVNPRTGKPTAARLSKPQGIFFASQCFYSPETVTLTTSGASLPVGVYYGNAYGANPTNTQVGDLPPCGYSAAQVQGFYGLPTAYQQKLNGAGQTVVIVDAYGSPTITADANAYSTLNGLPQLTSKNFQIVYPEGKPFLPNTGWIAETSLDVELSHATAPGAKIDLLISPSAQDEDFQYTILYAITHHLGSVISNSYGYPELEAGPATLTAYNEVIELGAASGISVDFATGDTGDNVALVGTPSAYVPADSPYATAVGGTSVGLPTTNGGNGQTGWGNNLTYLSFASNAVLDPPLNEGNYAGGGGGPSVYFAKPAYQKSLPGNKRQTPDVSALADPFTGAEIVITDPNLPPGQYVEVYGGTSLATPIFSAIWAITNQKAGKLLGQAAPIIASLNSSDITDIVPVSSPTNIAGVIFDGTSTSFYSAAALAEPLQNQSTFFSSIYNLGGGEDLVLTFGTDTSLTITPGWDNVTGYGTPNGLNFINAAAKK
jgi:subtilase family serine protease